MLRLDLRLSLSNGRPASCTCPPAQVPRRGYDGRAHITLGARRMTLLFCVVFCSSRSGSRIQENFSVWSRGGSFRGCC